MLGLVTVHLVAISQFIKCNCCFECLFTKGDETELKMKL